MSIYSGFSNRKLQDKYNLLLKQMLTLMNQIIITLCKTTNMITFKSMFVKIQKEIRKLDEIKFSEPKFSLCLQPLSELFYELEQGKDYLSQPVGNNKNNERRFSKNLNHYVHQSDRVKGFNVAARNSISANHSRQKRSNKSTDSTFIKHENRKTISYVEHVNNNNQFNNNNNKNEYSHNRNAKKSSSLYQSNQGNRQYAHQGNRYVVDGQGSFVQSAMGDKRLLQAQDRSQVNMAEPFRSRKVYRSSRQGSHQLINAVNFMSDQKDNSDYYNKNNHTIDVNYNDNQQQISMQQLMRRNPLVERKMSVQKKRRTLIKWQIPQINQQQQDENEDIQIDIEQLTFKKSNKQPQSNHLNYQNVNTTTNVNQPNKYFDQKDTQRQAISIHVQQKNQNAFESFQIKQFLSS